LFTRSQARWLGVQPELPGVGELPRVLLVGVPYALKAADADTLGGKPASAYVTTDMQTALSPLSQSNGAASPAGPGSSRLNSRPGKPSATQELGPAAPGGSGTANYIPIWTNSTTLGNSILFQMGGKVGVGTSTPAARLDVPGSGRDILIGDAGCGKGYGGIGFGALSACSNYPLLGDGTDTFLNRSKGGTLYFREGNGTEMVVARGGNVGIGTPTSLANLEVNGSGYPVLAVQGITNSANGIQTVTSNVNTGGGSYAVFSAHAANGAVMAQFYADGNGTGRWDNREGTSVPTPGPSPVLVTARRHHL
jgi:hypothetical protein